MTGKPARGYHPSSRSALSFSQQIKDELNLQSGSERNCQLAELAVALACAHRQSASEIILTTANPSYAGLVARLVLERYHVAPELVSGKETLSIVLAPEDLVGQIRQDLADRLDIDVVEGPFQLVPDKTPHCTKAILRAAFLASGSIRDPLKAYHLEFDLRREDVALWLGQFLAGLDIRSGLVKRHGHAVVYIKEGQQIADFLLHCGAHQSLLAFESLRVEKDMRNSVNRVVNCDSANSTRIANTAARQLELLHSLEKSGLFGSLPEELAAAGRARLENPDLSLKELGETLEPPLGKSGMNHRLKKLEQFAQDQMEKERRHHDD